MGSGKKVLELNEMWENADSNTIAENVKEFLAESGHDSFSARMKKLIEITGSSSHTVYAWMNRSRTNVKIPFLKLCMIAEALEKDVEEMLQVTMFNKR